MPLASDFAALFGLKNKRRCQNSPLDVTSNADAATFAFSTWHVEDDSFLLICNDGLGKELIRASESAPTTVSPVESVANAESSSAHDIVEEEPGDLYMKQLVVIKTIDGRDYTFEEGQIDTGNNAEFMLVGKRLVRKLGLKEEPLLGHVELRGIIGPGFRPTSFVRLRFKMPWLELDWVDVTAYVVDGNVDFNLGNRAVTKFGLVKRLDQLEQAGKGWVKLRRRGTASPSINPVNVLVEARSQGMRLIQLTGQPKHIRAIDRIV